MEGGHCLLTRDNHCREHQLLQMQRIDVRLEDWSSKRIRRLFALELLSEHSEGPKSCEQDTLPRKKDQRLMSEYCRDG